MNSPDVETAAKKCLELSSQAYAVLVDAFQTRNKRTLDNAKSMYGILSRPYPPRVDEAVRENFDRAQQIASLTVSEMQTTSRRAREVTVSLAETGAKLQEAWLDYLRNMMQIGLSSTTPANRAVVATNDSAKPVVAADVAAERTSESVKGVVETPKHAKVTIGSSN